LWVRIGITITILTATTFMKWPSSRSLLLTALVIVTTTGTLNMVTLLSLTLD
jgi:hypothetical protein